jgi:hypothetical protein
MGVVGGAMVKIHACGFVCLHAPVYMPYASPVYMPYAYMSLVYMLHACSLAGLRYTGLGGYSPVVHWKAMGRVGKSEPRPI